MTAYNGNMIYYDGMTTLGSFKVGNPTTYNNGTAWTFTWEHGRQLATMKTGSTTWTNTYNSDGLRTSRTDGTTTYTYYYEEGRLSAIKRNDLNMWIIYDENGPVTLKYGAGTFGLMGWIKNLHEVNCMRIADFPIIAEIKEEYAKHRRNGFSREGAVRRLESGYYNELTIGNDDDSFLFWIGVADAQYAYKELSLEIAGKGLAAISAIEKSNWNVASNDLNLRRKNYSTAPMSEQKVFRQSRKYRCTWNIGDTFAYQLTGDDAKECGLEGRYVLLRTVDTLEFGDGKLLPVVTFTMWDSLPFPKSTAEFQRLPILKLVNGRLGLPKSLYEYRAELLINSKKKLDVLNLSYLGNFPNIAMPTDEVVIRDAGLITMVAPERLNWYSCIIWKRNNNQFHY